MNDSFLYEKEIFLEEGTAVITAEHAYPGVVELKLSYNGHEFTALFDTDEAENIAATLREASNAARSTNEKSE